MSVVDLSQDKLNELFPASKSDDFFEAVYGGAEEGAYDIALVSRGISADHADMAFELRRRPGQCLKCSLTYGLPEVFKRHPLIGMDRLAQNIASALGWEGAPDWRLFPVEEINDDLHIIPFVLDKKS